MPSPVGAGPRRAHDVDGSAERGHEQRHGLHHLERNHVARPPQRAHGNADQVAREHRELQHHDRAGALALPDAGDRPGHHQQAEIRHERDRPAQPDPVERVAHPQRDDAEERQIEPERRDGAERGEEEQRGHEAAHADDPRQVLDPAQPGDQERDGRHAAHRQRRGARRQQLHVLADRRLPEDRERDERHRHAVRRGRQPLPGGRASSR